MEAEIGGKAYHYYGPVVSDLKAVGKRSVEWDLNDWKWDGDLFTAAPLNSLPSDCRSRQFFPIGSEIPTNSLVSNSVSSGSDEMFVGSDKGKRELEKRRRGVDGEDEELTDEAGSLHLKLGGHVYPITEGDADKWEGKSGKKTKVVGPSSNRAVCQVEDCRADLSNAKDYHRRHKVCDVHSKATRALVGNVMQRFCQQCSRFHVLQEFDEGKRSCRRRLAGHNKRRRKTHPESVESGTPATDERGSNYLLISLLRILSNIHSNNSSDQTKDQDLLSHLLRSLAGLAGIVNEKNLTGLLPGSQDLQNAGTSDGNPAKDTSRNMLQYSTMPASESAQKRILGDDDNGIVRISSPAQSTLLLPPKEGILTKASSLGTTVGKTRMNNIDLNNAYDDSQDCIENLQSSDCPTHIGKASSGCPLWVYQAPYKSSPPQPSGNSGSTSTQSPSSSSGEAQSRTDRIVFKLFGKDPSDFPLALRKQILDWLSHSPSDIESYIRPGCVILTIYIRMDKSTWEELCYDLTSSLRRLLDASTDSFWKSGWIYARVRHRVAFVYDGCIVLDTPLPHKSQKSCRILNIKPIAVCASGEVKFSVRGINLSQPTTRLLCALEGKYLAQERCADVIGGADLYIEHAEIQTLNFTCTVPDVTGRGFIEVEDHGLSSSFFPFIVAENDVCSEISTLESVIEAAEISNGLHGDNQNLEARNQALDFIHEIGWLLHRSQLKFRLGQQDPNLDTFPFQRFRWLIEFSVEHDWCAVVKMLLNVLFNKLMGEEKRSSIEDALLDIGLLHRAVRRNCRSMVEVLLRYHPDADLNKLSAIRYVFRPDVKGPGGLTPLHIAAGRDGAEHVLDALTDDPGLVGVEAWRSARDSTGLTPNDYACLRGHYSYIHLVQKKINKKWGSQHVVLEIPDGHVQSSMNQKTADENKSRKVSSLSTEMSVVKPSHVHCRQCEQKLAYGRNRTSLAIYRPAMLSMVAIAAVCVCVALLFKSSPEVDYVYGPFRWEYLEYGSS
ncbi:squamosa promoter-binding-like protein 1 [Coffea eugenioides]|uniref:squamosa promoter-binding-like protein 1 n=1 Tax=Coffea eugenioides TaxID=49369 RepID=UPI000F60759F|nr:squamosa promoter-binding-like protein 1 [Coffea eugenioides]